MYTPPVSTRPKRPLRKYIEVERAQEDRNIPVLNEVIGNDAPFIIRDKVANKIANRSKEIYEKEVKQDRDVFFKNIVEPPAELQRPQPSFVPSTKPAVGSFDVFPVLGLKQIISVQPTDGRSEPAQDQLPLPMRRIQ